MIRRCRQRVAISQEHPSHSRIGPCHGLNLSLYLIEWADGELFTAVHRTEATAIKAATQCGLQDKAVRFGGRPPERHIVVKQHTGYSPISFFKSG
ncbi:hypothetical protein BN873_10104 [Candidatus Competibacter denitrificans Run_A_D11]|uniref:Uncharacterized protein n=1 Tax=Candidatus Competibacter denitrificans Run_A_D11 TaxID=1400863 RepID=W6MAQ2_9GAMM|nr:hypothetical protein BN873_10104 [Candidatus Competibacter denitrificans Run_A_D11]